jgi:hypothetical protein
MACTCFLREDESSRSQACAIALKFTIRHGKFVIIRPSSQEDQDRQRQLLARLPEDKPHRVAGAQGLVGRNLEPQVHANTLLELRDCHDVRQLLLELWKKRVPSTLMATHSDSSE